MEYTFLGRTGVKVSGLCFGTMSFGGDADEETSAALYHHCREAGINFFDCADVYEGGRSEEILGRLAAPHRQDVVLMSKVYYPTSQDHNGRGATRKHIRHALEASLKRLQTDYIDIYFIHRFDDFTDLEDTLRTLDDLVSQGKILYLGASNFAAWQVEKALGISARQGWARFEVLQPMYNLVKRQAEVEILPMAFAEDLAVTPYSPLGAGLLTGKYSRENDSPSGRLANNKMYAVRYGEEWMHASAERYARFAGENGYDPASLAIAWVAAHPAVTAPIIGARNLKQLESALSSVDIQMIDDLYQKVSELSPEPPPATDRNEERTAYNYGSR